MKMKNNQKKDIVKKKIRLICFDLDGVLLDEVEFSWKTVHAYFGVSEMTRKSAMQRYLDGKITYPQWVDHNIGLWKKKGADKNKLRKAIADVKLMYGAKKLLSALKKKGYLLAIVSGGMDFFIQEKFPEYQQFFDHVFINELVFDNKGKLLRGNATRYDMETKGEGLRFIARKEGLKTSECAFIGNNKNDTQIAKTAGFTISFNSKSEELDALADAVIKKKDLSRILEYF